MTDKDKEVQKLVIIRLQNLLRTQGNYVYNDKLLSISDKCLQMDVILDCIKFLEDYHENVKVLNKHCLKKKQKEQGEIGE